MSTSSNSLRPTHAARAASVCSTARAVAWYEWDTCFELDAFRLVPAEHAAWLAAKKRHAGLAKALDSVPADHRTGAVFDAVCVALDYAVDDVVITEAAARAAFRRVAA